MTLYADVVDSVRRAHVLDENDFVAHIRTLVPALHELRASYRSGWGSVAVTYSRAVTEAYLLAYYPHYVGLTRAALEALPSGTIPNSKRLRVCAFATGPAPEPVAVGQFLEASGCEVDTMALALYDIVPDRWEWARTVSVERVLPIHWGRSVRVVSTDPLDITAPDFVVEIEDRLRLADLVLFQNCLNEFPADQAHVRVNAEQLIDTLKPGGVLLMADLNNYPTGRECLDVFAQVAMEKMTVLLEPSLVRTVSPASGRPAVLDANFFVAGGYPRRRSFEFRCLAAKK